MLTELYSSSWFHSVCVPAEDSGEISPGPSGRGGGYRLLGEIVLTATVEAEVGDTVLHLGSLEQVPGWQWGPGGK